MGTHNSYAHLNQLFHSVGGPTPNEGTSDNSHHYTPNDTGSPATTQNESEKMMWTEYMKEAERYDIRATESWKEDSNGLLVFVRPMQLFPLFFVMTS
jgi:hypothetical protein